MKKTYENAEIEIIKLDTVDLLTASDPSAPFDGEEQPFGMVSNLDH